MQVTILAGTAEITIGEALGGDYAIAQSVRIAGDQANGEAPAVGVEPVSPVA